jgi:hypothetical protein
MISGGLAGNLNPRLLVFRCGWFLDLCELVFATLPTLGSDVSGHIPEACFTVIVAALAHLLCHPDLCGTKPTFRR